MAVHLEKMLLIELLWWNGAALSTGQHSIVVDFKEASDCASNAQMLPNEGWTGEEPRDDCNAATSRIVICEH